MRVRLRVDEDVVDSTDAVVVVELDRTILVLPLPSLERTIRKAELGVVMGKSSPPMAVTPHSIPSPALIHTMVCSFQYSLNHVLCTSGKVFQTVFHRLLIHDGLSDVDMTILWKMVHAFGEMNCEPMTPLRR
jgi:hypothetical protein